MTLVKDPETCTKGCGHDGLHAIGVGPSGRNELCAHAGHCLDVFLTVQANRSAAQSHCPPRCSAFVDYREVENA